jgi:hypothetical protein
MDAPPTLRFHMHAPQVVKLAGLIQRGGRDSNPGENVASGRDLSPNVTRPGEEDAARLLEAILVSSPGLTREELWARLELFLPAAERLKPSYALDDLWQSKSSSSQS